MSARTKRICDLCKQVDDHPHFVLVTPEGIISGHHDCHAENGNEDAARIVKIAGKKQGHELLAVLQSGILDGAL